ncbi:MAG: alpha/beta fold hydrolase [Alphaproteobacteria bacterium]|nr:alpha/beta fold hydrolase [Alphaproteobacteria bacterium]
MSHSTETVSLRGLNIHLRKGGQGRPLLFLHGAGGVFDWLPFFDSLAVIGELWVPDHPGFGRSDDPAWIRSIADLAMYYLDFLDAYGDERGFDLIGHSIGGWLAAEIAVRNCARVRSLTLISPAGLRVKGVPMADIFIWNDAETAHNLIYDEALRQRRLDAQPDEETADIMVKNRYSFAKHAWQPRLFNPDLEKWLHRVKAPAQIIWGQEDRLLPAQYAEVWKERVNARRVAVIPACGHSPMVEKGPEVAARINEFLREEAA